MLKKYGVFIISFAALYVIFQLLLGWVLTAFYSPNFSLMENSLSQKVEFGEISYFSLINHLIIATLAYLVSLKFGQTSQK